MIKDKRNIIYVVVIVVVFFLTSIVSLTFAYINRPTATGNTNISTNIGELSSDAVNITYSGDVNMSLNVTLDDLSISNSSNNYDSYISSTGNLTVNLTADTSTYTNGALCGYSINYVPTVVYNSSSEAINAGLKELTISGTNGSAFFNDVNVGGITTETPLYTSNIFTDAGVANESQTWTFTMKFYNLNVDQSGVIGKNATGTIKIVPTECRAFNDNLVDTILALESKNDYTSSQTDGDLYRVVNQFGVRYEGTNPDNYVTFNNGEEWRIIGVFDGADIGLTKGKKYTKIVKSVALDSDSWDWKDADGDGNRESGEGINVWEDSTIRNYLINEYYPNMDVAAKEKIVDATWYLGAAHSNVVYNLSEILYKPNDFYLAERGSILPKGTTDTNKLTIQSQIGLIYPSDYALAMYTSGGACDNQTSHLIDYQYYAQYCYRYDWLYDSSGQWTIMSASNNSAIVFGASGSGHIDYFYAYNKYKFRPTVYLDSSVAIASGTGAQGNPYILK